MIHPTAKVSKGTNRNMCARNTLEQLLALRARMHSVTDRRTDRQTDGQQAAANSRSYCVAVRSANKTPLGWRPMGLTAIRRSPYSDGVDGRCSTHAVDGYKKQEITPWGWRPMGLTRLRYRENPHGFDEKLSTPWAVAPRSTSTPWAVAVKVLLSWFFLSMFLMWEPWHTNDFHKASSLKCL